MQWCYLLWPGSDGEVVWGDLSLDNPGYRRDAASSRVNNARRVAAAESASPWRTSSTDDVTEEEYNTAGATPVPRWTTTSGNSGASSSSSTSSSTPLSIRHSAARTVRTDSVVSAPPLTRLPAVHPDPMPSNGRRSTVAGIARSASVPAVASRTLAANGSSKLLPLQFPARKPNVRHSRFPKRALFCLSLSNPLRKLCIRIVDHKYPFSVINSNKKNKNNNKSVISIA